MGPLSSSPVIETRPVITETRTPLGDFPTSCGGDPVNLTTGIFTDEMTDLVVPDVLPLVLTRSYNSQDIDPTSPRPFGIGMSHPYAMFLHTVDTGGLTSSDLILGDGGRIYYVKTAESGANWWQRCSSTLTRRRPSTNRGSRSGAVSSPRRVGAETQGRHPSTCSATWRRCRRFATATAT